MDGGYDAFFKDPVRGLIEAGCWAYARRYFHQALESDQARMGLASLLIARLDRVEREARPLTAENRLRLLPYSARAVWGARGPEFKSRPPGQIPQ